MTMRAASACAMYAGAYLAVTPGFIVRALMNTAKGDYIECKIGISIGISTFADRCHALSSVDLWTETYHIGGHMPCHARPCLGLSD